MAIIKAINSKSSIKNIINYVSEQKKTEEKLMSGKDCSEEPKQAIEDMKMTKEIYKKTTGRQYKHFVQSFNPNDNITPEKAHQIGKEWAEKTFKGYEVFIATHTDKEHLHNHFVVNSVSFETGEKLRYSSKELQKYKEISDKICEREGLSKTPSNSKDITTFNMKKYKVIEKGLSGEKKSYLVEIGKVVEKNINISTSKEEFISNMEKEGYKVKWSDTRKNITYEDKEGNKVRADRLAETFKENNFKKEEMLKQFEENKNIEGQLNKEIEESKNVIDGLQRNRAELEKVQTDLKQIKADKEQIISNNTSNKKQIEKLKTMIGAEQKKKGDIGIGLFKKNRVERKMCDDRISKYANQISSLEEKLIHSDNKINGIKQEIAEINTKINWTRQKIDECNEKLREEQEKLKKAQEKLNEEKERKQRNERDKNSKQRIPSNFREIDDKQNKTKKKIKRNIERER